MKINQVAIRPNRNVPVRVQYHNSSKVSFGLFISTETPVIIKRLDDPLRKHLRDLLAEASTAEETIQQQKIKEVYLTLHEKLSDGEKAVFDIFKEIKDVTVFFDDDVRRNTKYDNRIEAAKKIMLFDDIGIYGKNILKLYNDVCGSSHPCVNNNSTNLVTLLKAVQLDIIKPEEIKTILDTKFGTFNFGEMLKEVEKITLSNKV